MPDSVGGSDQSVPSDTLTKSQVDSKGAIGSPHSVFGGESSIMKISNHGDECVEAPLHAAVAHGDVHQASKLLQNGDNVNCMNAQGETPLHRAIEQQNEALVRLLVKHGADLTIAPPYGVGLLYQVVETGNLVLIQFILKRKECRGELLLQNHLNPLVWAIVHEQVQVARLLLLQGASINVASERGETPLFLAAMGTDADRQFQLAILLLHHGADPTQTDTHGHMPMHYSWHNAFTAYLTEYGLNTKSVHSLKSLARHVVLKRIVISGCSDSSLTTEARVRRLDIPTHLYDYLVFTA